MTSVNKLRYKIIVSFVQLLLIFAFPAMLYGCIFQPQSITISDKIVDGLSIVLPNRLHKDEVEAANELKYYLEKIAPISIGIYSEIFWFGQPAIHVGRTKYVENLGLKLDAIDLHGYVIKTADSNLVLAGRKPYGTRFAVYGFLQDYMGVRWFMPFEMGEYVPKQMALNIPHIDVIEEPDYLSRLYSGLRGPEEKLWSVRMRMQKRFNFHHNLGKIILPSKYGKDHPEYFPLRKGKRYIPKSDKEQNWQPCTSNPEVIQIAAQAAIDFFDKHPEEISYNLGVNDSKGWCECENCRALDVIGYDRFIGRNNYSDRFFTFMNAVAKKVEKVYPDKYLGCLAYLCTERVPFKVNLHPMIIPYYTNDRAQWMHPEFKRRDQFFIWEWTEVAKTVGIYDYYYGVKYVIPRFYPKLIAESIKYAYKVGVRGFYAEAYPNWGLDGPKLYLASRLMWDTSLDPNILLDEYYDKFFGKAAPFLKKYFERAEQIYTSQKGPGKWLKDRRDVSIQLELFNEETLAELKTYLKQAKESTDDPIIEKRIAFIQDAFTFTELNSKMYHISRQLNSNPNEVVNSENADNINSLRSAYGTYEVDREKLFKALIERGAIFSRSRLIEFNAPKRKGQR